MDSSRYVSPDAEVWQSCGSLLFRFLTLTSDLIILFIEMRGLPDDGQSCYLSLTLALINRSTGNPRDLGPHMWVNFITAGASQTLTKHLSELT